MVCLDHLRENGLLFEKKIFPLALFAHWEFPDLTSHLMAWHACSTHRKYLSSWREETETAIEETCSLYFEEFHWGDGREGRGNIPKKKSRLSYGRHGKTVIFHARKCDGTPQKKTDSENTGTGVTWDRWNSDRMGRILLWDKCTVFFNIGPSRANLKVSVDKIGTDWQKAFLIHKKAPHGCITSSPFLQCRLAILHILDSAMVGQGIVSLGGFFTMCRVRVSRPHLKPQVLFLLVQAPHSLHWPTSQPSAEKDRKKWCAVKPQRY